MSKDFIERPRQNEKDGAIAYVKELLKKARDDRRSEDIDKLENLMRLLNTKKYGLVWEEHAEIVEEEMKSKIPVLVENKDRKIVGNPESDNYNFLIEGDNLHSLHLLEKTHRGKIDVIYIDPPYNTGNKDFIYNDKIVDKNDGYSHSKWLSFMSKRLKIAQDLLSDSGVIFISIDDNEQAQLKLLCDEVFGEDSYIGHFIWIRKKKGSFLNKKIRKMTEYILCYIYNKEIKFYGEQAYSDKMQPIIKRTNSIKDLLIKGDIVKTKLKDGEYKKGQYVKGNTGVEFLNDFNVINGIVTNSLNVRGRFVWTQDFLENELKKGTVIELSSKFGFNVLRYNQVEKYKTPSSLISSENGVGTNEDASGELSKILKIELEDTFDYSKPSSLIKYLLNFCKTQSKNSVILDFFAGSGTTGHAVAQLNKEDGGNRKYILCTNNENKIAEEVTYKRLANIQEDLPHNLKYFKTDFVVKEDFPNVVLEYELLNYVTPLVELEFGVDIENPKVQVILSEEQLDNMNEDDFIENSTLFFHPEIFFDAKQEKVLRDKHITRQEIPHYYFGKEIWS